MFNSSVIRFLRHNADAFAHAHDGVERIRFNIEIELTGKSYSPHHPEWIVGKRSVGATLHAAEWSTNDFSLEISESIKRVDEIAKVGFRQTDTHGIDRKVTPVLIIFQRSIFHNRLPRLAPVRFFTSTHKLDFDEVAF